MSRAMVGAFVDLDVGTIGHKAQALPQLPDEATARAVIAHLPSPSIWMETGGGYYAWWLFDTPWLLPEDEERAAARTLLRAVQGTVIDRASAAGLHVDNTATLDRVLRVAGTVNRKEGLARPCRVLEISAARYPTSQVADWAPEWTAHTTKQRRRRASAPGPEIDLEQWLKALPPGPACPAVIEAREALLRGLPTGRHAAILGPLVNLARQGAAGHTGVAEAISVVEADFKSAVAGDRPAYADQEWAHALTGAAHEVGMPKPYALCICRARLLRRYIDRVDLGVGKNAWQRRRVLRYLAWRAELDGSCLVGESVRQISQGTLLPRSTADRALRQLRDDGWLTMVERATRDRAAAHLFTEPLNLAGVLNSPPPTRTAGLLDVPVLGAEVHELFGDDRFAKVEELFALLPEVRVGLGGGRQAIRTSPAQKYQRPGHTGNPWYRARSIPRARGGIGPAVEQLATALGLQRVVVVRMLEVLAKEELALAIGGRWYRYRFDPDWIATHKGIVGTVDRLRAQYAQERTAFRSSPQVPRRPEVADVLPDEVDATTGEILGDPGRPQGG